MFDRKRFLGFFARVALSFAFLGMTYSAHAQRDDQRLLEGWLAKMGKLFEQARAGQDSQGGLEKARALRVEMFREIAGGPLACEFFARVLLLEAIFEFQVGDTRAAGWHYQEALSLLPSIGDRFPADAPDLVAFLRERKRGWEALAAAEKSPEESPSQAPRFKDLPKSVKVQTPNGISEVVFPQRKTRNPKPVYPPASLSLGKEEAVELLIVIDKEGRPKSIFFADQCARAPFYVAAADAVFQWRYEPALFDGKPVDMRGTVRVDFHR